MNQINIGQQIQKVVIEQGISESELARRINVTRSNVYSIYKREHIDTGMLLKISEVLKHDFFQYYTPLADENKELKIEIEHLKKYIQLLNKEKT